MIAYLEKALNVRRRELLPASLLFTYLFLVIGAYIIGQSAGDALFLNTFPNYLPHAIMATAATVGVFVSIHIRLSKRLPLESLSVGLLLFFAISFALLWWATGLHTRWVYALNFVWVYAAGAMAPIVGWTLANYVLTTREAQRVFGFIGAGAILGGTCAGLFTATAAASKRLGPENLILVMAVTLAVAAVLVKMLFLAARQRIEEAQQLTSVAAPPRSLGESWRLIRESRYLLLITALIAIGCASTTVVGYQFKIIAKEHFANKEALTAFFGRFYGYIGLASFFLQIALTGRLLRSFGIRVTLFVLPVVFLGGSSLVFLLPTLLSAIILKGSHNLLRYSLDKSSAELLWLPVPAGVKNAVKSFIDGFVWRTADGAAGLVLLGFATMLHFGPRRISLVTLVFCGLWIAIAAGVRREYLNVLRRAIQRGPEEPAHSAFAQASASEMLALALDRGDEQQVLYGLSLYEQAREPRWYPLLRHLLQHPSAAVRARAVRLLTEAGDREVLPQVQALLRDRSAGVRTEALHYLVLHTECDPVSLIRASNDFPDYALAGAVVAYLARLGKPENFAGAQMILEQMLGELRPPAARAEAARMLGVIPPPSRLHAYLLRLLRDEDAEVVRQALASAGHLQLSEALPLVVERLGQPACTGAAGAALVQYGDRAIPALQDYLNNDALPMTLRIRIPATLARIATSQASGVLALSLVQSDPALRFHVVKALNKLRRGQVWVITQGGDFHDVLHAEITGFYRSFQILAAIDPEAAQSLDGGSRTSVLARALSERMEHELERIFRMLALVYPARDIHNAFVGLRSEHPQVQANALEVLEHILKPGLYRRLLYALDPESTLRQKLAFAEQLCRTRIQSRAEGLRALLFGDDRWLRACALHFAGELGELELYDDIRQMPHEGDDLLQETWLRVTAKLDSVAAIQGGRMLSILERVDRLQRVPMFEGVRTESLARVASLAREVGFRPNEVLYRENDAPDCMYVLLEGEVAMTRDRALTNRLGAGEVAGVLGVLSGEVQPETARVTKPTRALKLDQQDFYDAMADDFQVTRGILRALVSVINTRAAAPEAEERPTKVA